ncbi:hypothetical protein LEP1GSC081_2540 [Leptospira kirschneri str. H1]|uniref:Uncharacterized protein n=1 Tax=Leptospira kirschneri str. H1 TaxID=1049966 RepID=A0A0E2AXN5_9LEPT|nr:hypothetical protein LEP1GSC081_2540 [Leptospira kirschneri str. H1]
MERKELNETLFKKALTQRLASTVARSNPAKRSLRIALTQQNALYGSR